MEVKLLLKWQRKSSTFPQSPKPALLNEDQFQLQNLDDIMIEEISLLSLSMPGPETESLGRLTLLI
jgi:hypothetical protein